MITLYGDHVIKLDSGPRTGVTSLMELHAIENDNWNINWSQETEDDVQSLGDGDSIILVAMILLNT